jgi:hypothetical protein
LAYWKVFTKQDIESRFTKGVGLPALVEFGTVPIESLGKVNRGKFKAV